MAQVDPGRSPAFPTARGTVAPTRGQVAGGASTLPPKPWRAGFQGPGASRGLQASGPCRASRPPQTPAKPPSRTPKISTTSRGLKQKPQALSRPQERLRQGPSATSRGLGGLQEPLTSFKLSTLSTYANEEVLLLTKMDLTEFRS